jgi:cytochrome c-type biogenesis protein
MIALEGNFAYSFLLGVLAAVNPCGFVLLPAYLMYFLGLEGSRPDPTQRASVQRALVVSASMSAGFIAVFLVVGTISRLFTRWVEDQAKYIALVVGIGLIVMGIAMAFGWKPKFATPNLAGTERRDRTVRSMFFFGIAYAVASIGCTIGFLTTAIFGSISNKGFVSGVLSIVLYGAGMAMLVTALTVTLAFAQGGLLRFLRNGLRHMDRIAAAFLVVTGLYLTVYWYAAITDSSSSNGIVARIERLQADLANFLQGQGAIRLGIVLGLVIVAAIVYVRVRRPKPTDQAVAVMEPDA